MEKEPRTYGFKVAPTLATESPVLWPKRGRLKGFVGGFDPGGAMIEEGNLCFTANDDC